MSWSLKRAGRKGLPAAVVAMHHAIITIVLALSLLLPLNCGGDASRLEEAEYLIATGTPTESGRKNYERAGQLLDSLVTNPTNAHYLRALRLRIAAYIGETGVNHVRILTAFLFYDKSNKPLTPLKDTFANASDTTGTIILAAITLLGPVIQALDQLETTPAENQAALSEQSSTLKALLKASQEDRNQLRLQLALLEFIGILRIAIVESGKLTGELARCADQMSLEDATQFIELLALAKDSATKAGASQTTPVVERLSAIQTTVGDLNFDGAHDSGDPAAARSDVCTTCMDQLN